MKNYLENGAVMDSYRETYRLKIEELRRMLHLYSDIFCHIRNNLLWEESEIDIAYWESALSSPQKTEDFDDDLLEFKEQMERVIEYAFLICGYEKDFRTGEYKKTGVVSEE